MRGSLEYVALAVLIIVVLTIVYGMVAMCDIPHRMAAKRNHPHQDAIRIAGWFSLFVLHALEPFLWIWASLYDPKRGWGFSGPVPAEPSPESELTDLRARIAALESRLRKPGE